MAAADYEKLSVEQKQAVVIKADKRTATEPKATFPQRLIARVDRLSETHARREENLRSAPRDGQLPPR